MSSFSLGDFYKLKEEQTVTPCLITSLTIHRQTWKVSSPCLQILARNINPWQEKWFLQQHKIKGQPIDALLDSNKRYRKNLRQLLQNKIRQDKTFDCKKHRRKYWTENGGDFLRHVINIIWQVFQNNRCRNRFMRELSNSWEIEKFYKSSSVS